MRPKKVLVLGSGALKIGQAGEFDYSGSQAIKALKEEGIKTIVINPNIASVQTSQGFADRTYFLPINPRFVERVMEKERPDGILLGFGGQTALNCGLALHDAGVLKRLNVKVLGTEIDSIRKTEDRELFKKELESIGVKVPVSAACKGVDEVLDAARKIGYPVIIRAGFALGGEGSAVCRSPKELEPGAKRALLRTPQILVEEYLHGWKEIEYEVVRDSQDNCVTICNMENFDPLGIHTGESIVVAPSQTLTNEEYHRLREIAIKVVRHLGIVGECNIQFALGKGSEYRVIEVNARLSRSSSLASKATGYPLAFIAAKLALGRSLVELKNAITKSTMACFEPSLDYVVVKVPRWDFSKFRKSDQRLGTEMKSVGEVMAIGRSFEEALQKALRMLHIGAYGLVGNKLYFRRLIRELKYPTDKRVFAIVESMKKGVSVRKIATLTNIDPWFLFRIKDIVELGQRLEGKPIDSLDTGLLRRAKKMGFSDKQIAILTGEKDELSVRTLRERLGILPVVRQIDTLAAEFPSATNYLYVTYDGEESDLTSPGKSKVIVLGSGAYKIGSSVEFDWCCVETVRELRNLGYGTIMVNFNPETVSTDYDTCDTLYFEELSLERVLDICSVESPLGVIVSVGGQIPNGLAAKLQRTGVRILGTSAESIDACEDRRKFSVLCDRLGVRQPLWKELTSEKDALEFAAAAGFPVIVRPSYVLSGDAMRVAYDAGELSGYLRDVTRLSQEHPVVISKFVLDAKEIEIDGVARGGKVLQTAVIEHIENAGVHSGDATMVIPPQRTSRERQKSLESIARRISGALKITGPFNIQFLVKGDEALVIECNLRASRSMPFVSKVLGENFITCGTRAIMGKVTGKGGSRLPACVGVKAPQFSFSRLKGADPVTGVEMASTGEVGCIGRDFEDALLKALLSTGLAMPKRSVLLSISGQEPRERFLDSAKKLSAMGCEIFATDHTHVFLKSHGIGSRRLFKLHQGKEPNIASMLSDGKLDMVICVPDPAQQTYLDPKYNLRRMAVDCNVPLITNLQLAETLVEGISKKDEEDLDVRPLEEYSRKR